ncbi:hypothetical protein LTR85_000194 [Meristemomyces frigidus]|nr:hypothetical protein LTR85_000194 [Meristemomyces frigidus]
MALMLPPVTALLPPQTSSLINWYSIEASKASRSVPLIAITPLTGTFALINPSPSAPTVGPAGFEPEGLVWMTDARGGSALVPYVVLYLFWSLVVAVGLLCIWIHRERKATKIRDWRSITVAVLAIHLLFTACLIATWIPHKVTCHAVFWLVGLLIPTCFAAFQIPNARLVSYYLANKNSGMTLRPRTGGNRVWRYWQKLTVIERTYFTVIVGLLLQFLFTTFMYFGSRCFHASYGLWGHPEDWQQCMYGFEWVVSMVWQLVWAYGTGFFLLREIRHVKDVYHWAVETRIVIFASMPGPLLWAIFMFADGAFIRAVNKNWPPRNWIIPGLAIVQFVLISFPLWDAAKMERKDEAARLHNSTYGLGSSINNMINIIDHHSEPLIDYAASTRFNAELIIFLRDVKKWRTSWKSPGHDWAVPNNPAERVACYKHAALIFFKLVHPRIAAFAINIDAKTRNALAEEFKYARYVGGGRPSLNRHESVAPWTSIVIVSTSTDTRSSPLSLKGLEITLAEAEATITLISPETLDAGDDNLDDATTEGINLASYARQDIAETFTLNVFNEAYKEVRQEAYYNVWLPYWKAGRYRQDFTASTEVVT